MAAKPADIVFNSPLKPPFYGGQVLFGFHTSMKARPQKPSRVSYPQEDEFGGFRPPSIRNCMERQ